MKTKQYSFASIFFLMLAILFDLLWTFNYVSFAFFAAAISCSIISAINVLIVKWFHANEHLVKLCSCIYQLFLLFPTVIIWAIVTKGLQSELLLIFFVIVPLDTITFKRDINILKFHDFKPNLEKVKNYKVIIWSSIPIALSIWSFLGISAIVKDLEIFGIVVYTLLATATCAGAIFSWKKIFNFIWN